MKHWTQRTRSLWWCAALCAVALTLMWSPDSALATVPRQQPRSCGSAQPRGGARAAEPAATTASARVSLNIAQGAPGARIIVRGSGWPANAAVTLTEQQHGSLVYGSGALGILAGADGTFAAPPLGAPGLTCGLDTQPGAAIQFVATSATVAASASFTYIAAPPALVPATANDTILASATDLPVVGSNWDAGTLVTLWPEPPLIATPGAPATPHDPWQPPAGTPSIQVRADAQGAISARVPMPPGAQPPRPGAHFDVAASATSARYGTVRVNLPAAMYVLPTVAPVLLLDRSAGLPGTAFGVAGDHWWPGDNVYIAYCRDALRQCNPNATQALGSATVDGGGHFSVRVALPVNARSGPITVEAYAGAGHTGPYLVARVFQVEAGVPPALPWNVAHPRLARALPWLGAALLALVAGLVVWWLLARQRRLA